MYSPFLRMDDPHPSEILTDAAVHVLAERGLASFSVGALARWMKVTPAAVLKATSRAQVIEIVCARVRLAVVGPGRVPDTDRPALGRHDAAYGRLSCAACLVRCIRSASLSAACAAEA